MTLTAKMLDLSKIDTGLNPSEKAEAHRAGLIQKAIAALGSRYVCDMANAPRRGRYNELTGAKLS